MGKLSKILIVLAMLMAMAATFLSFKLMQARDEFVLRAEKLSATVVDMVKTLDNESATEVAKKVTFTPGSREANAPEKGSLSRVAFKDPTGTDPQRAAYQKTLDEAKALAKKLNEQRNALAAKLSEIATTFNLQDVNPEDLKNAADAEKYTAAAARIADLAHAIRIRDDAMVKSVVAMSGTIKHPVEEKGFNERASATDENGKTVFKDFNHAQPLADLSMNITNLFTRAGDYAKTLSDGVDHVEKFPWQVDKTQIPSETEYAGSLTAILTDYDGLNTELKKFEICRNELDVTKKKLENTIIDLNAKQKLLAQAEGEVFKLQAENTKLKKFVGSDGNRLATGGEVIIDPNLEGRVLQVNKDWNFVILNLGANKVRESMEFLVARDDKFIARLQVSKVFKNVSIAEILPDRQTGPIEAADRVILPKQQ